MMEIFIIALLPFVYFGTLYLTYLVVTKLKDKKRKNNIKKYRGSYYYDPDEDK